MEDSVQPKKKQRITPSLVSSVPTCMHCSSNQPSLFLCLTCKKHTHEICDGGTKSKITVKKICCNCAKNEPIDQINEQEKESDDENAVEDINEESEVSDNEDDLICNYDEGYLKQSLYSCKTCRNEVMKRFPDKKYEDTRFAFCLACKQECHANHEVFAIWPKRHFRCDCGGFVPHHDKEYMNSCTFGNKHRPNLENKYGHNFDYLFCWCNQPDAGDRFMFQCIICEDWYHKECIEKDGKTVDEAHETDSDFICKDCIAKLPFISSYAYLLSKNAEAFDISPSFEENSSCLLKTKENCEILTGNVFFKKNWKSYLCKCEECMNRYKELVPFIFEEEDTVYVLEYEEEEEEEDDKENENKE